MSRKVIIMGAAGRDFHVFNCCYRDSPDIEVVAFTATQIPHIEDRRYPAVLAGKRYPNGIPIYPEEDLGELLAGRDIDEVIFAYSDVNLSYIDVRRKNVEAHGVRFSLFDVDASMLPSTKPVVAITAVRTGCGKSQVSRRITDILRELGKKTVAIRHPMPYGDLAKQGVQRFETYEDLKRHDCTIEEREEYEPHIDNGVIVYAGADYAAILAEAEKEADVIVWDGGNNDTPFYKPDLWITVTDPHRAGHELLYFPGTVNFQRADIILISKIGYADEANIKVIETNASRINPDATVLRRNSPLHVPDPDAITDKRVLVIEDGPTTTHGGMPFGAGVLAAMENHAGELVDPRPWAVGEIAATFEQYPDIGDLLPAMGYGDKQIRDLELTVNAVDCDLVLVATPIDLTRLINIEKPHMRIGYSLPPHDGALTEAVRRAVS
ncbi:MAG: GTPase [Gammaproteobacteria bacterium]|nr:GTPase [Gammaproteobacteria bacterium]MBT8110313.1 GTPase [Gammaproteobacteria bacterium]NNL45016.1 GTPase [Woeseiaceae bacterium]